MPTHEIKTVDRIDAKGVLPKFELFPMGIRTTTDCLDLVAELNGDDIHHSFSNNKNMYAFYSKMSSEQKILGYQLDAKIYWAEYSFKDIDFLRKLRSSDINDNVKLIFVCVRSKVIDEIVNIIKTYIDDLFMHHTNLKVMSTIDTLNINYSYLFSLDGKDEFVKEFENYDKYPLNKYIETQDKIAQIKINSVEMFTKKFRIIDGKHITRIVINIPALFYLRARYNKLKAENQI
jgi:hypothetical protein